MLGASFAAIGGCAKAEAARTPSFRGVTLVIGWSGDGRAESVTAKEASLKAGPLVPCVKRALETIRFPRFAGPTRTIEYPIRLK